MINKHSCGGKVWPVYKRCNKHDDCKAAHPSYKGCLHVAHFRCANCQQLFTQKKRLPNTVTLTFDILTTRKLRAAWKSARQYASLSRKHEPSWEEFLTNTLLHAITPGDE